MTYRTTMSEENATHHMNHHDPHGNLQQQQLDEELQALNEEVDKLKLSIQMARESMKDTCFEALTENVEPLGRLKFNMARRLCGHLSKVTHFAWCHEGTQMLSVAQDGKMILWEGVNGNKLHMVGLKTVWVTACGISPDSSLMCSGGLDNLVSVYSLKTPSDSPLKEIAGHGGYISKCRFFHGSQQILSSSGDCTSILWDVNTGRSVCEFHGHKKDVSSFDLNPTMQQQFITSSMDGTCRLWDIRTGRCCLVMDAPEDEAEINDVALFPQADYGFICATEQGWCHLWDLRADQPVGDYSFSVDEDPAMAPLNPCTCITISKSGRIFFVGQDDAVCRVYDVLLGEAVAHLFDHESRISGVGISGDGQALATASWDTRILLYTGKPARSKKV